MDRSTEMALEELQLFEGTSGMRRLRSRRLSAEDIESLQKADGKYKRTPSKLKALLEAGSLRSLEDMEEILAQQEEATTAASEEKDESQLNDAAENNATLTKARKPKRRISWDEQVHVNFHEMILGYNISVTQGAPVEIDWEKFDYEPQPVHEKLSKPSRQMQIPPGRRMELCRAAGATGFEIMQRIENVDIFRQQHAASVRMAKAEDRKALLKAQKEAAKQKKKASKQNHAGAAEQDGCSCIIL